MNCDEKLTCTARRIQVEDQRLTMLERRNKFVESSTLLTIQLNHLVVVRINVDVVRKLSLNFAELCILYVRHVVEVSQRLVRVAQFQLKSP